MYIARWFVPVPFLSMERGFLVLLIRDVQLCQEQVGWLVFPSHGVVWGSCQCSEHSQFFIMMPETSLGSLEWLCTLQVPIICLFICSDETHPDTCTQREDETDFIQPKPFYRSSWNSNIAKLDYYESNLSFMLKTLGKCYLQSLLWTSASFSLLVFKSRVWNFTASNLELHRQKLF